MPLDDETGCFFSYLGVLFDRGFEPLRADVRTRTWVALLGPLGQSNVVFFGR